MLVRKSACVPPTFAHRRVAPCSTRTAFDARHAHACTTLLAFGLPATRFCLRLMSPPEYRHTRTLRPGVVYALFRSFLFVTSKRCFSSRRQMRQPRAFMDAQRRHAMPQDFACFAAAITRRYAAPLRRLFSRAFFDCLSRFDSPPLHAPRDADARRDFSLRLGLLPMMPQSAPCYDAQMRLYARSARGAPVMRGAAFSPARSRFAVAIATMHVLHANMRRGRSRYHITASELCDAHASRRYVQPPCFSCCAGAYANYDEAFSRREPRTCRSARHASRVLSPYLRLRAAARLPHQMLPRLPPPRHVAA